jgi:RNA polymerase sigma-70 factor (ECF subfamily)
MDNLPLDLIRRAQSGDAHAFEAVYAQYRTYVFSICLRMAKNWPDAEDLTQEVFLHLFRSIGTFKQQCKFSTWLHKVAVTVVLGKLRPKRISTVSIEPDPDDERRISRYIAAEDRLLQSAVDRLTLLSALDSLAAGYRLAFLLHAVYGFEHSEVATILGYTRGTSKSQVHKARLRLRELLIDAQRLSPPAGPPVTIIRTSLESLKASA